MGNSRLYQVKFAGQEDTFVADADEMDITGNGDLVLFSGKRAWLAVAKGAWVWCKRTDESPEKKKRKWSL